MSPLLFLALVFAVTLAALIVELARRRRRRRQLLKLAGEMQMAYSPADRFAMADRVAAHFPFPGAAALRVFDLFYASEPGGYRYLFSVEYTNGVIRSKHRSIRVATFFESRGVSDDSVWSTLMIAPPSLPLIEQYRHLATTIKDGGPKV